MPERYQVLMFLAEATKVLWIFAVGACVGSLINVLVYRLPRGLDVVRPTSRCPSCGTLLTWRENVPILGWLALRGRCRFCRSSISPEYPAVEALVAFLFAIFFLVCYAEGGRFLGVDFGAIQPEWARAGFAFTWPVFAVLLTLMSCVVAMILVDAKTYQIPLVLTWVPAAVAIIAHPTWAWWVDRAGTLRWQTPAPGWSWALATPASGSWWWIGGALGGTVGVAIANVLLSRGLIRRSFADYEAWERDALANPAQTQTIDPTTGQAAQPGVGPGVQMWIQYPHARREMFRELIFLAPVLALGLAGGAIAVRLAGPWTWNPALMMELPTHAAPFWLEVLAGVLLGYLVGGGLVWAVRILGSLAFGKEAMGLGDVHMLAAIGACLGWTDAVLIFFGATFVGVFWAVLGAIGGGAFRRAMPFGPFLGVAAILVWLGKPGIEWGLTALSGHMRTFNLP